MRRWILQWEVSEIPDEVMLGEWDRGLARLASTMDPEIVWRPSNGTVSAPSDYTDGQVADMLWRCVARFAGIVSTDSQVDTSRRASRKLPNVGCSGE